MNQKSEKKQEEEQLPRMLNLGSGNRKLPQNQGWINIDIDASTNPDVIRNLDKGLPFDTNSVDAVYSSHTIEHVDDVFFFMYEIWRVCKPDAKVEIIAPNHAHLMSIYPNHKRFIRPMYFEMWTPRENTYDTVMNNFTETMGAEFISINESVIENCGALRFHLIAVKEGGEVKKELKTKREEYDKKIKEFNKKK